MIRLATSRTSVPASVADVTLIGVPCTGLWLLNVATRSALSAIALVAVTVVVSLPAASPVNVLAPTN